jgi:hypothetical protein
MKYYIAEYEYSANLAEFEGEKIGKSYKLTGNFRELRGWIFIPRSNNVLPKNNRYVTDDKNDAIRWLVLKVEKKINGLKYEIERECEPEKKSLIAMYDK